MTLLILFLIIAASTASPWDKLTANIVVVEFEKTDNTSMTEGEKINSNAVHYLDLMFTDTSIDMYIFPEGSLGYSRESSISIELDDFPCESYDYPAAILFLSCLAQTRQAYIVTNVVEKVKCADDTSNDNCKNTGYYYYNTDIVFSRTGRIVYRYRKYNLFGEQTLDRPEKPEVVTFTTDFNVKFGIFTCFDILFKNPAQDLLKMDVDGIIYPTNWHSELPFLTALQSQQMFAYEHDIMVFAAGGNYPKAASGGSGVHRGARDSLFNTIVADGGSKTMLYQSVNGGVIVDDEPLVDDLGKEMDAFPLMVDNSLKNYTWIPLNISQKNIDENVCHKSGDTQFCCNFKIDLTYEETNGTFYKYFLGAYSGVRYYPEICNAGLEVCAIIACLKSTISSCGQRFPKYEEVEWPLTFNEISISAKFEVNENKTQFPNSLLASIRPIDASQTNWTRTTVDQKTVERTFTTRVPQNRVLTFAIYGRNFGLDVFPRDNTNAGISIGSTVILSVLCLIMLITTM